MEKLPEDKLKEQVRRDLHFLFTGLGCHGEMTSPVLAPTGVLQYALGCVLQFRMSQTRDKDIEALGQQLRCRYLEEGKRLTRRKVKHSVLVHLLLSRRARQYEAQFNAGDVGRYKDTDKLMEALSCKLGVLYM